MPGRIKRLIDELMELRTGGSPGLQHFVRVQLVLSGVDPDNYAADSPDDEEAERILRKMIDDFKGIR